jgi:DNA-binding response OmpR family regulator
MNRHVDGSMDSRGTVLVASDSSTFINIVGDMLVDGGFTVAFPAESEAAWLSVTRTQPALVICDSGVSQASLKRLIAEVAARRLPLLMAWSREEHDEYAQGLVLPDRVEWLAFPIHHDEFLATIDGLVPRVTGAVQRLRLTATGARTLDAARRGATAVTEDRNIELPDRTVRRSIRLLP